MIVETVDTGMTKSVKRGKKVFTRFSTPGLPERRDVFVWYWRPRSKGVALNANFIFVYAKT